MLALFVADKSLIVERSKYYLGRSTHCLVNHRASFHDNTSTKALAVDRLKKTMECISCGPLSTDRLEINESGLVKLKTIRITWTRCTAMHSKISWERN